MNVLTQAVSRVNFTRMGMGHMADPNMPDFGFNIFLTPPPELCGSKVQVTVSLVNPQAGNITQHRAEIELTPAGAFMSIAGEEFSQVIGVSWELIRKESQVGNKEE